MSPELSKSISVEMRLRLDIAKAKARIQYYADVARAAGIRSTPVVRHLGPRTPIETFYDIAEALNCEVSDLIPPKPTGDTA